MRISRSPTTLLPFLNGEERDLQYAVRRTYFPNIDLIPACLALYEAEISIVMRVSQQATREQKLAFFNEFRFGIQTVAAPLRRHPGR